MEELEFKNLNQDDVLDLILDFPIEPTGRNLIITMNTAEVDGNVVLSNNQFSEVQYVLAAGDTTRELKPGQKVFLDVERMVEYVYADENSHEKIPRIKIKSIDVGDNIFAIISDAYVLAKDNR